MYYNIIAIIIILIPTVCVLHITCNSVNPDYGIKFNWIIDTDCFKIVSTQWPNLTELFIIWSYQKMNFCQAAYDTHCIYPVSYTHLDVYKRQNMYCMYCIFIYGLWNTQQLSK